MSAYDKIAKGLGEALEWAPGDTIIYDDGVVNQTVKDYAKDAVEITLKEDKYYKGLKMLSPVGSQIGGDHYSKFAIQPLEFAMANQLDACQSKIVKYIMRHDSKNGKEDLLKARDVLDKMIEFYYGGDDG